LLYTQVFFVVAHKQQKKTKNNNKKKGLENPLGKGLGSVSLEHTANSNIKIKDCE
jgi:hypothetical protein